MERDPRLCPMPRHDEPRRAAPDSLLCPGCGDRAAHDLRRLPHLHAALLLAHNPPAGTTQRVSGSRNPGLAFNADVAREREVIDRLLASWVRIVAEERDLSLPTAVGNPDLAAWLGRHLAWALRQPWADELAADLAGTVSEAHRLCYPSGRRRFVVGPCLERVACDVASRELQRCGGYLVAFVANQQDLLPSTVTCGSCGVEEPASRWITYAARARRLYGEVAA